MRNVVRFRLDIFVRIFADIIVLACCTFVALAAHFFSLDARGADALHDASRNLGLTLLVVIPIGIVTFAAMGLYTTATRGYPMLRKTLRVSQAVTLLFAAVTLVRYFVGEALVLPG